MNERERTHVVAKRNVRVAVLVEEAVGRVLHLASIVVHSEDGVVGAGGRVQILLAAKLVLELGHCGMQE